MWFRESCFCRFDPFDSCVFFDWNFHETVRTCFGSRSFVDFETFSLIQNQFWLGLGFGSNGSDPLRIHIDSDSVTISLMRYDEVLVLPVPWFGGLNRFFRFLARSPFWWTGFASFLSSSDPVQNLWILLSFFFSVPHSAIALEFTAFCGGFALEL